MDKTKKYNSQKDFIENYIEDLDGNFFTLKEVKEALIKNKSNIDKRTKSKSKNELDSKDSFQVNKILSDKAKDGEFIRFVNGVYLNAKEIQRASYIEFNDKYFGINNWLYASKTLAKKYGLIAQDEEDSYTIISNKRLTDKAIKELKRNGITYKYATSLKKAKLTTAYELVRYVDFEQKEKVKILKDILSYLEINIEDFVYKYIVKNKDKPKRWIDVVELLNK